MKKLILVAVLATLTVVTPAHAQMDWLTPHLETQRWNRRKPSTRKPSTRKAPERYPEVRVNGQLLKSSVAPVEVNGQTFVPFRDIFEALGATVTYNRQKRLITAKRGSSTVQLSLPGSTAKMEGNRQNFDRGEMPFFHRGVVMVPLRMVSKTMGVQIKYVQRPTVSLISITNGVP
ncbi:copper amine oxidase N-terminal domain-containing protein [Nostocaceae cyanobacterium CENA357]|uniref:Copper amine oxidase N-terminal domain-containing protein n=1 Tax=Atlanticothrix silvestris CENA357 TaxID=1725252 RepID=A0A8J7HHD7_9CYAN|nr:copper amine oxidase N-terminal domain-containing protein [Atlanticothrix silvestris]MBH8555091.1 copper amine oxidase N-terminal domain-containing protein [Atlanticothrix silvestris CENA357]